MSFKSSVVEFSVRRPWLITWGMIGGAVVLIALAAVPTLWPPAARFLHPLKVDTDPENMLPAEEPVRRFHNEMKQRLSLHDILVVGVINDADPHGVFNPASLARIRELTEYAKTLEGVIPGEIIAPSEVFTVEQNAAGSLDFPWLMRQAPADETGGLAVRDRAMRIPFLKGTLVSDDGKAICLYISLASKDYSHEVADALRKKIKSFGGPEHFYITGLPVAEDTFGTEMFVQMAISAPLAMGIIFLLMWLFFRKVVLIVSPMIVAMASVAVAMGLLVATGNTVHIMSSMIPIFIAPIAVLDAVHILSEFFDRYQRTRDRRQTIIKVMDELFTPMLYTSLTTAVGFASLALTPIPPVQIFGLFVALGVMAAWVLTITFIPAFVMFIPEKSLANFGAASVKGKARKRTLMEQMLSAVGRWTYKYAKLAIPAIAILAVVSAWGMSRITINDNPVKWFSPAHEIRIADEQLNRHFGGTYMAYLALLPAHAEMPLDQYRADLAERLTMHGKALAAATASAPAADAQRVFDELAAKVFAYEPQIKTDRQLLQSLSAYADQKAWDTEGEEAKLWQKAVEFLSARIEEIEPFKQPKVLDYVRDLQEALAATGIVGKSNSEADIARTVYRDLTTGKDEDLRIPRTAAGVAQVLEQFVSGQPQRKDDLWHFVTKDWRRSAIWVQLKSGDNRDMAAVARAIDQYVENHPAPMGLRHEWFGLTWINVVWQDKMVTGMLQAFLGSFLIVFLMMTLLYRSALWGFLSMIPLTLTIGLIYGAIGIFSKDYDMPVAVLSSLSLGLAVDYAIHFLTRSRELHAKFGSWKAAAEPVFGEPARAITRNVIVIGVGFLPLLLAPLVPYQTVGLFIAAILIVAGAASLLLLPMLITLLERWLFPDTRLCAVSCKCVTCITSAVALVGVVAINLHQMLEVGFTDLTLWGGAAIVVMAAACFLMSRRERCRTPAAEGKKPDAETRGHGGEET